MIDILVDKRVREGWAEEADDSGQEHLLVEQLAGIITHINQIVLIISMVLDSMYGSWCYTVSLAS